MRLDSLSELLLACPYPSQMEHIDCGILGAGYYPGAQGFSGRSPEGGVMLLGRDFGTKSYYDRLSGTPAKDETAPTWQRTKEHYFPSFQGVPIWCTNYLLGKLCTSPPPTLCLDKVVGGGEMRCGSRHWRHMRGLRSTGGRVGGRCFWTRWSGWFRGLACKRL